MQRKRIIIVLAVLAVGITLIAKRKTVTLKNNDTEQLSVILRATGCARVIDGQTLACDKKTVAPGATISLTSVPATTGKVEMVVFKGKDRYTTQMTLEDGDSRSFPQDFKVRTGGTVMLPGISTYSKLKIRNETNEPIRAFIKRIGCADIRTDLGQIEGLLCAHDYVQPGQTETLEIKAPYREGFQVIVFQQMKDIRGYLIGVRYSTTKKYNDGDTVVWPTDFDEAAGFQQKADDAFRKVHFIFKGIGLAIGGLKELISRLKTAAGSIKSMQPDLKSASRAGDKALVIAKMIEELVPAIGVIAQTIDDIGKYLIEPFDKDAYEKAQEAADITAGIQELVLSIDKSIKDLAPTINAIEVSVKDIQHSVKTEK